MAVFRQTSWPNFDQNFGRFSAKILVRFRPKFWSVFGQNFGRFPTKKTLNWIAPMGLGERPFDATLAFANFYGEPSEFSREALPDFQPKLSFFLLKTKIRNQKQTRFCDENRPQETRGRGAQIASPLAFCATCVRFSSRFFDHFRPRFWPPFCCRNFAEIKNEKRKTDTVLAQKRTKSWPKNGQQNKKWTILWTKNGQGFGRKLAKLLAENRPKVWTKSGQKFGRKSDKFFVERRPRCLSRRTSETL